MSATSWGEGIGVAVDAYHVWWDPKLEAQIPAARAQSAFPRVSHLRLGWCRRANLLNDRGNDGRTASSICRASAPGWKRQATRVFHEVEIFLRARLVEKRPPDDVLRDLQAAAHRDSSLRQRAPSRRAAQGGGRVQSKIRSGLVRPSWLKVGPSNQISTEGSK